MDSVIPDKRESCAAPARAPTATQPAPDRQVGNRTECPACSDATDPGPRCSMCGIVFVDFAAKHGPAKFRAVLEDEGVAPLLGPVETPVEMDTMDEERDVWPLQELVAGGCGRGAEDVRDSALIAAFAFVGIVAFTLGFMLRAALA